MEPTATAPLASTRASLGITPDTPRIERPERSTNYDDVPVLRAREGGLAERLAELFGDRHPVTVFLAIVLTGYVVLAASTVALGFLLTRVILATGGVARADERVEVWLAAHRTAGRTEASLVGSIGAGGVVLPIIVGSVVLASMFFRRWRIAAFVLMSLAVESGAYRLTTIFVHRRRPDVPRLESLPVNASYPSGHVAASIAVYIGLALLLTSYFRNTAFRVAIWITALAIPPFVGVARMYRGMHHPLDTLAGILLGIAALLLVLTAARASGVAQSRRLAASRAGRA